MENRRYVGNCIGSRDTTQKKENQLEKKMEHEMETGMMRGFEVYGN